MTEGGLKGLNLGCGYRSSDLTMAEGGLKRLKLCGIMTRGCTFRAYSTFSRNPGFLKRKRLACVTLGGVTPFFG